MYHAQQQRLCCSQQDLRPSKFFVPIQVLLSAGSIKILACSGYLFTTLIRLCASYIFLQIGLYVSCMSMFPLQWVCIGWVHSSPGRSDGRWQVICSYKELCLEAPSSFTAPSPASATDPIPTVVLGPPCGQLPHKRCPVWPSWNHRKFDIFFALAWHEPGNLISWY